MISFTIPTLVEKVVEENNITRLVKSEGELKCQLDTSISSEITWEEQFPAQAKNSTLFDYFSMLKLSKKDNTANILSQLKVIYCFIVFKQGQELSFREFTRLFNFSDIEYLKKLAKAFKDVFELIYPDEKKTD